MQVDTKYFSADSHVVEPPNCYVDHIEAKYKDVAPHIVTRDGGRGQFFDMNGSVFPYPLSQSAASGWDMKNTKFNELTLDEVCKGAYDPKERLLNQDQDNVCGEIIYPTIGLGLNAHPDVEYKHACMQAYNRWLQEFVSYAPDRLIGIGTTALTSVEAGVADLQRISEMGFKGVMLPCEPDHEKDYHDTYWDPLWRAAIELKMPISFHVLTGSAKSNLLSENGKPSHRGPKANAFQDLVRANQEVIGVFIWGGVFARHPDLKMVCVEADSSWAPHFVQRMDHYWLERRDMFTDLLPRRPSEYFRENIHLTFQHDWVTFDLVKYFGDDQLMWANDHPHPDATWPRSQKLIEENTKDVDPVLLSKILQGNVKKLYNLV